MQAAFVQQTADFSGMNGRAGDLVLGAVFHQARVEVNEEGTEAAGASAVETMAAAFVSPSLKPKIFKADHPFMFFIRERKTNTVLFSGHVIDPK